MENELKLAERPILAWIIGLSGIAWGGYAFAAALPAINFNGIVAAVAGLLAVTFAHALTVVADKQTGMLTLRYRSVFLRSTREIPINQIQSIHVDSRNSSTNNSQRKTTYQIEITLKNGEKVPFRSYYNSNFIKHQKWADQLRAFLELGEAVDETPMGMFRAARDVGQAAAQRQQEALTGINAEMRVTDGVNWQAQSFSIGAASGTRWFSPDFKTQNGFLFIAQKFPGKAAAGFLASLGKALFKQSLSLYGFRESDTPNLDSADTYASLSPALDRHFTALTNAEAAARQILNPWTQNPLAAWGERYPLQQFQSNARFGQIVVLFNTDGVYIATQGVLTPDKLNELASLGVELVRAQGM